MAPIIVFKAVPGDGFVSRAAQEEYERVRDNEKRVLAGLGFSASNAIRNGPDHDGKTAIEYAATASVPVHATWEDNGEVQDRYWSDASHEWDERDEDFYSEGHIGRTDTPWFSSTEDGNPLLEFESDTILASRQTDESRDEEMFFLSSKNMLSETFSLTDYDSSRWRRVRFLDPVVTAVRIIPRVRVEDISRLFYSLDDIMRFREDYAYNRHATCENVVIDFVFTHAESLSRLIRCEK